MHQWIPMVAIALVMNEPIAPHRAHDAHQLTIPVGQDPGSVVLGDLNNDGRPDIIVANTADATVTVLLNDGARRFTAAPGSPFPAGHLPNDIAVADMNRDGHPDLVIANHQTPYITVLLGRGDGAFTPARDSPFATGSYPHPHGVAVADFTGDGAPDVVVDSWGNNRVALIDGGGDGRLTGTRQMFQVGRRPYERLRTADLNHDGHPDIVTTNLDDGTVTVLLGDGRGRLEEAVGSPFAAGPSPWAIAIDDIDGDGNLDLAVIPYEPEVPRGQRAGLTVLLGDGRGSFKASAPSPIALAGCRGANAIATVALGWTNHEGVAVGCAESATIVVIDPLGTRAVPALTLPNGRGPTWSGLAAADLDADGADDLVFANGPEGVIRIEFDALNRDPLTPR